MNVLGPIFLSHSSLDKLFVRRLAKRLTAEGYDIWLDEKNLVAGDPLSTRISEALATCRVVLVVVTPSSVQSRWLKFEISKAATKMVEGSCRVIPLLKGDVEIPVELRDLIYADFRRSFARGFNTVLAALQQELLNASRDSVAEYRIYLTDLFDEQGSRYVDRPYEPFRYDYVIHDGLECVGQLPEPYSGGNGDEIVYEVVTANRPIEEGLDESWWGEYIATRGRYETSFFIVITERPITMPGASKATRPYIWRRIEPGIEQFGTVVVFADASQAQDAYSRRDVIKSLRGGFHELLEWVVHLGQQGYQPKLLRPRSPRKDNDDRPLGERRAPTSR